MQELKQENETSSTIDNNCTNQNQEQQQQQHKLEKKLNGWTKSRRKKKPYDSNAPKHPLTGYIRFINDRRDQVRKENPNFTFTEITRLLGLEWSQLPADKKQGYLEEAEKDKERYLKEILSYKQTEAYKTFRKLQLNDLKMKQENSGNAVPNQTQLTDTSIKDEEDLSIFEIPIFTEEFLDHNKARETELRNLRKQNTELEEENATLGKYVDSVRSEVGKMESQVQQLRNNNGALQQHLNLLRSTLAAKFADISLPGTGENPTLDSIDAYMSKLHSYVLSGCSGGEKDDNNQSGDGLKHGEFVERVKKIISGIRFDN